jgi:hypothetical protein
MLGGLTGFSLGLGFGLASSGSWPLILWRASVAALCAGWLSRWWGGVWVRSLRESNSDHLPAEFVAQPKLSLKK